MGTEGCARVGRRAPCRAARADPARRGRHLLALINDILDLSKIEAGRMDLNLEQFAVEPLVEDVAATVRPLAEKNGNRLDVECASDVGAMRADPTRLRQALLNLAGNAAKFTANGRVTISAARELEDGKEWVVLQVDDTGIGMTPEQTGRLFREFMQADASTTRNAGHNLPYVIDAAGAVAPVDDARCKPLGIRPEFTYTTATRALTPGDCLYLYTDGITEASDAQGRLFDEARLEESLRANASASARAIVEASIARVREFVGDTPQSDDIAAMALRVVRTRSGLS
jgi:hypothetical protein